MKKLFSFLLIFFLGIYVFAQSFLPTYDSKTGTLKFNSLQELNSFIDYYSVEERESQLTSIINNFKILGFKSLLDESWRLQQYSEGLIEIPNEDIEEDIYIADDRLAMLLNSNRELIVNNQFYLYNDVGVFFSNTTNIQSLKNEVVSANLMGKSSLINELTKKETVLHNNLPVYALNSNVYFFPFDYKNSVTYHSEFIGENKGGTPSNVLNPYNLVSCEFDDSGFFESLLPGSSEKCIDHFEDKKRIVTKFSNQNYLIFSSAYAKVKSQEKKKFIINYWNKTKYADFLELGLSNVALKYPKQLPSLPTQARNANIVIRNNFSGSIISNNGLDFKYDPKNFFDNWPFKRDIVNYEIYYFAGSTKVDSKVLNNLIKTGIDQLIRVTGKSFEDLFSSTNNTKVGMAIDTPDGIYFVNYGNKIRKYNTDKIEYTWDFNFLISYKANAENPFSGNFNIFNSKTYEVIDLDMYGAAKYNGIMRGRRIFSEKEVIKTSKKDSDKDGVQDDQDACINQFGLAKNNGCPAGILKNTVLFNDRFNEPNNYLGGCENLEIKSVEYPNIMRNLQGMNSINLNIPAGKQIKIKGDSEIKIKPNNNRITLSINPNICNIQNVSTLTKTLLTDNSTISETKTTQNDFTISPNPTSSQVQINSTVGINEWFVYDINAKVVLSGNNKNTNTLKVNLHSLASGLYYFKFTDTTGTLHEKTIIKK
ncbi:hypothetical protein EB1_30510 [Empedobacter brevis NBRC 14943 = ATCC 43319]|uniref:Secretion system C-terminal sorting domain-containing protein n=1 Tax=Empedobacter brevis NBRC 14943 = ATCC 43319 TaxID=1218108 RepID=A0A511NM14_9FLAO|nr:T9SS type A sorting domain-containing protein [Empedobacter brevis]GEM53261.1 hypothetical protein EB1_30510 [Empedobacter brevis NBRC 14943 = ATCC 43319]